VAGWRACAVYAYAIGALSSPIISPASPDAYRRIQVPRRYRRRRHYHNIFSARRRFHISGAVTPSPVPSGNRPGYSPPTSSAVVHRLRSNAFCAVPPLFFATSAVRRVILPLPPNQGRSYCSPAVALTFVATFHLLLVLIIIAFLHTPASSPSIDS